MTENEDAAVEVEPTDFDPAFPDGEPLETAEAEPEEAEEIADTEQPEEASDSSTDTDEVPPERIDEVTKARRNAERQLAYWKERALALESEKPTPDPSVTLERTLEDFDYDVAAFTQYVREETERSIQAKTQEQQMTAEQQFVLQSHLERESKYSSEVEDYEQVAFNPNLPVSPLMADIIRRSDMGPQMLYHLGKNPEVSAKISSLPLQLQGVEMGRIAEKISAPKAPNITKTPPPPQTLEGKKAPRKIAPDHPDSDELSDAEWLKRENERLAKLGRKY